MMGSMRVALLILLGMLMTAQAGGQAPVAQTLRDRGVLLAVGRWNASESERVECYFSAGLYASVALDTKGESCKVAQELIGKTGTLVFIVDANQ